MGGVCLVYVWGGVGCACVKRREVIPPMCVTCGLTLPL